MTLVEFLQARLDEDEAEARDCADRLGRTTWHDEDEDALPSFGASVSMPLSIAEHAARHDPARVLAECEAKRWIVEDHDCVHSGCPGAPTLVSDPSHQDGDYGGPCQILRHLATVYADHPDYDEAWRL